MFSRCAVCQWCSHRSSLRAVTVIALIGVAAARPCNDNDWHFDFTECVEQADGSRSRSVFAYAPPGVCDQRQKGSRPLPQPLLGIPCHQPCGVGTRLAVDLVHGAGRSGLSQPATMRVNCRQCEAGSFSLGGGFAIEGSSGDWARKPWPGNIRSFCFYRGRDYKWYFGKGPAHSMACVLHLLPHSGAALLTETRPGTWNSRLPDVAVHAPMVNAPGDSLACHPFPAASAATMRGKVVLVKRGACTFQKKTGHAHQVGALAVVVYNNIPQAGYFYPAAVNESTVAPTPIFMITKEAGERWKTASSQTPPPQFSVASSRCNQASKEPLPSSSSSPQTTNLSAAQLARESWDSISKLGCSAWSASSDGQYLHSGFNLRYHWMFSVLEMSVRFVRDGHVAFRYSIDAESGFDGMNFVMDDITRLEKSSKTTGFKNFHLKVPRGEHFFRWTYMKDYSGTGGKDRAKLQLLEVVGTEFSDMHCRSCRGARGHGSASCAVCAKDEYLDDKNKTKARCKPCPQGYWALPGSIGESSCKRLRACMDRDIKTVYASTPTSTETGCKDGMAYQIRSYRQPIMCNPARPDSVRLPPQPPRGKCPPCESNEERLNGGECKPITRLNCPTGEVFHRIRQVTQWRLWPKNFSTEIWGPVASVGRDPWGRGWQLAPDTSSMVVGSAVPHTNQGPIDAALLHLHVKVKEKGKLHFTFSSEPENAWETALSVNIDGEEVDSDIQPAAPEGFVAKVDLEPGLHRITWTWHFDQDEEQSNSEEEVGSSFRLKQVHVWNAEDGGASKCMPCEKGSQASSNGESCTACPAGRSSASYDAGGALVPAGRPGCWKCPAGRHAAKGSASCKECGANLQSGEGAARCEPVADGFFSAGDPSTWNLTSVREPFAKVRGNDSRLLPLRVEDRLFYIDLFLPSQRPGDKNSEESPTAYWWERLPPRDAFDPNSESDVCNGDFVRSVGTQLEAFDRLSDHGLQFQFTGQCTDSNGTTRSRKSTLKLLCNSWGGNFAGGWTAGGNFDAGGWWHVPGLQFVPGGMPRTPASCEDITLSWHTPAGCVFCSPDDWEAIGDSCTSLNQRVVSYQTKTPCAGGAPMPKPHVEACSTSGLAIAVVIGVSIPVSLLLCCLCCYIILLRRRYAPYMKLEEDMSGNAPEPSVPGLPSVSRTPTNV